jgi:hypothetical protein
VVIALLVAAVAVPPVWAIAVTTILPALERRRARRARRAAGPGDYSI